MIALRPRSVPRRVALSTDDRHDLALDQDRPARFGPQRVSNRWRRRVREHLLPLDVHLVPLGGIGQPDVHLDDVLWRRAGFGKHTAQRGEHIGALACDVRRKLPCLRVVAGDGARHDDVADAACRRQRTSLLPLRILKALARCHSVLLVAELKRRRGLARLTSMWSDMAHASPPANVMATGLPVSMTWPVGVSAPVARSTLKLTIVSLSSLAA